MNEEDFISTPNQFKLLYGYATLTSKHQSCNFYFNNIFCKLIKNKKNNNIKIKQNENVIIM